MTVGPAGPTLADHVARARQRLAAAGIQPAEAALDARLLAQEVLGWDASRLFRELPASAPSGFQSAFDPLLRRRERREPMAYILGRKEFWHLTFDVTPAVLIPRPETETIIDVVLARWTDRASPLLAADVCTGSGCLAVVLATQFQRARILATDVSPVALTIARRNATRHQVHDRVGLVGCDLLSAVSSTFDLVTANPPYVPEAERLNLQPEVRDHEPDVALFAGLDGTRVIRSLVNQAANHLKPGGILVFELGADQAAAVTSLVSSARGLRLLEIKPDLQGIPRTAIVERVRECL